MLSVLIVDDETYVCEGIAQNIPWNEFGIQTIHQAHTGREGLAMAVQLRPDIIISDVRMPHMDGLDMASALQESGLEPQIIFMSAYSELSYYKRAIKLHAVSFVEKPIILDELHAEIRHAVQRIQEARGPRLSEAELNAYGLSSLLRGEQPPAASAFRQHFAGFACYTLCLANQSGGVSPEQCDELAATLQRRLPGVQTAVSVEGTHLLALAAWPKYRSEYLQRFGHLLMAQLPFFPAFVSGGICVSLEALPQTFRKVQARQDYAFFHNGPFFDDGTQPIWADETVAELCQHALDALAQGSASSLATQAQDAIARYFAALAESGISPDRARSEALRLLGRIQAYMHGKGLTFSRTYSWSDVAQFAHLQELCSYCVRQACQMVSDLDQMQDMGRGPFAIMQEIQASFCQPGFSIATLAEKLHFSESYLSSVFKKQFDTTVGAYINKLRMEKAKELLLQPGARVSQVAAQVGFDDTDYFTKRFRQYTGQTPREYRR